MGSSKNVIIVDDSIFMRGIIKEILQDSGYNVVGEASNGKEAVKFYKELKPDIVTMDIVLPDVTGIEVVKNIKKIDADAKILMITALNQKQLTLEAIKAGANDFISKPFKREDLLLSIKKMGG